MLRKLVRWPKTDVLTTEPRLQATSKVAVLTYRVLHGDAPRYLGPFTSTADVPGRRALRLAGGAFS